MIIICLHEWLYILYTAFDSGETNVSPLYCYNVQYVWGHKFCENWGGKCWNLLIDDMHKNEIAAKESSLAIKYLDLSILSFLIYFINF